MSQKKVTMAQIAKEAGVAKSTVSRYFNGGYVKQETRQILAQVIEKYEYAPSQAAAMLKLEKTKRIGVVAPTLDSTTSSRMLLSMDAYLKKRGYTVLIINTSHDTNEEIRAIETFQSMRVDGIIFIATNLNLIHQRIVHESQIPILILAQHFKNGASIIYDDYRAGYDVGSYAAKMGHENVLYLGVSRVDDAVGVQRKKGVLDALNDYKVPRIHTRETDFSYENTRKVIRNYLQDHHPTLIIAATDNLALACYKEILAKGLRVPEDISLIGFGGYDLSELLTPSLCTVRFDNELAGQMAGSTILSLIAKEPVATTQVIGYGLVKGESVLDRTKVNQK
jgi:LacI family sucrose operon transcriptional repressor